MALDDALVATVTRVAKKKLGITHFAFTKSRHSPFSIRVICDIFKK
jgi:hypothetical protein